MQRHPLRTLGIMVLSSIAGIVGQLVIHGIWNVLFLGLMLTPLAQAVRLTGQVLRRRRLGVD